VKSASAAEKTQLKLIRSKVFNKQFEIFRQRLQEKTKFKTKINVFKVDRAKMSVFSGFKIQTVKTHNTYRLNNRLHCEMKFNKQMILFYEIDVC
jgi:hypothetical protein